VNILLIEPDRILGEAAKQALEAIGHSVVCCRSAQTGLDALDSNLPDVIILELQLGIHNGIEFLYEVRSYPEWKHIAVVVHTLNVRVLDERFQEPFSQLGVKTVLYKPHTTTKKLAQVIGQFAAV